MKIPWIRLIVAGIILFLAIVGIQHVSRLLPPSKVNLVFKGWSNTGSNSYAKFDMVNMGPRNIYWYLDGAIIFETESGWVTNGFEHFSYVPLGTPPGSNEPVSVRIPQEAVKWLVRVDYTSFQKHNVRLETVRKVVAIGALKHMPEFMDEMFGAALVVFPIPKEEYHEIFSGIFTNKPDATPDMVKPR